MTHLYRCGRRHLCKHLCPKSIACRARIWLANKIAKILRLRSRPPFAGVLRGPGRKCPTECISSDFGHSEASAQNHSKCTPWGTFRPGPLNTPVNGGRDRNIEMTRVSKTSLLNFVVFRTVPRIDCQGLAGERPPKNGNWPWTCPKLLFSDVGIWKARSS